MLPLLLVVATAAPAGGDVLELGPFRLESSSRLIWPGVMAPDFALLRGRRRVTTFTLGFKPKPLRPLSLSIVTIGPNEDPHAPPVTFRPSDVAASYGWAGASLKVPRTKWGASVGQAVSVSGLGLIPVGIPKLTLGRRI